MIMAMIMRSKGSRWSPVGWSEVAASVGRSIARETPSSPPGVSPHAPPAGSHHRQDPVRSRSRSATSVPQTRTRCWPEPREWPLPVDRGGFGSVTDHRTVLVSSRTSVMGRPPTPRSSSAGSGTSRSAGTSNPGNCPNRRTRGVIGADHGHRATMVGDGDRLPCLLDLGDTALRRAVASVPLMVFIAPVETDRISRTVRLTFGSYGVHRQAIRSLHPA